MHEPLEARQHLMLAPPHSAAMVDMATDLAMPVIATHGLPAVTPRVIGEAAGCSRQAVHQWFGSASDLQCAVAGRFVARWTRWCDVRAHFHGLNALLPDSDPVLGWTRVWLALSEAAHRDPRLEELAALVRRREREIVATALGTANLPDRATTLVHALVEGLRQQLASAEPTTTWAEATAVIDRVVAALATAEPDRLLA